MKPAGWKVRTLGGLLWVWGMMMACGGGQDSGLEDTEWSLTALNGAAPLAGTRITINFAADTLEGFAGCNRYSAEYSLRGSKFNIPEISSSAEECLSPEGAREQEAAYLNILSGVDKVRFVDRGTLELHNTAREAVLVFRRQLELGADPAVLERAPWALRELAGQPPLPGTPPLLNFKNGAIQGSTGCRTFRADYRVGGDDFQLLNLEVNEIACARPQAYQEQEQRLLERLEDVAKYRVTAEEIALVTVQGESLVYGALPGGTVETGGGFTWLLQSFSEKGEVTAPLPGAEINLIFPDGTIRARGSLSGSAGCTLYEATYAYDGAFFTALLPDEPEAACDPAITAQQERYLDILGAVKRFETRGETLRLETGDGRGLLFGVAGGVP